MIFQPPPMIVARQSTLPGRSCDIEIECDIIVRHRHREQEFIDTCDSEFKCGTTKLNETYEDTTPPPAPSFTTIAPTQDHRLLSLIIGPKPVHMWARPASAPFSPSTPLGDEGRRRRRCVRTQQIRPATAVFAAPLTDQRRLIPSTPHRRWIVFRTWAGARQLQWRRWSEAQQSASANCCPNSTRVPADQSRMSASRQP